MARRFLSLPFIAVVSFAVAASAIALSRIDSTVALVWPVNAVMLIAMLWRNDRLQQGLARLGAGLAGVAAANFGLGMGPESVGFALANGVECRSGVVGLRAVRQALASEPDNGPKLATGLAAAVVGPLASSLLSLLFMRLLGAEAGLHFLLQWGLSNFLGLIIFLPAVLLFLDLGVGVRRPTLPVLVAAVSIGFVLGQLQIGPAAIPALLIAFPVALAFAIYGGIVSAFLVVLAAFGAMVYQALYRHDVLAFAISGSPAVDIQIAAAFLSVSTVLSVLVTHGKQRAQETLVAALKDLEGETRRSTALRDAIDQMRDAFVLYDAEDRVVEYNSRYLDFYPQSAGAIRRGAHFEDILRYGLDHGQYPEAVGREEAWLRERLAAHRLEASEMEQLTADGRWLLIREFGLKDGGRAGFRIDITDRKRLAESLRQETERAQSAVRAKDRFLATMSHELRTPLNAVLGMAQAFSRTELASSQRDMLDIIVEAGRSLLRLLNDLLECSRLEMGEFALEMVPFRPWTLLKARADLFSGLAAEKNIQLETAFDLEMDATFLGDEGRIGQVISNLLSNAIKFTDDGTVTLAARIEERPDHEHPALVITVKDQGIGVSEHQRKMIFDRFEQTDDGRRRGGAGLGLAICEAICKKHGGAIRCDAGHDGGSVFIAEVQLERALSTKVAGIVEAGKVEPGERRLHLLVAEDNGLNRKVMESLLRLWNPTITFAGDGEEAVEAFAPGRFDAIFMDIEMPKISGEEAIRRIRAIEAEGGAGPTPIIAWSAHASEEEIASFKAAGASAHLAKPIELDALQSVMEQLSTRHAA